MAFTQHVCDVDDEICAFCGSEWRSPMGNPEVEAAHIYPKREKRRKRGNGIALCYLHYWAFDLD
ncbi:HNH endonuclease [Halogeometricum salsisoli]|uniref:HNH endonuclease n=1 Tax=Halogeometricum salsisoli TaxID=2950536 RepID=UPI0031B7F92B